MSDFHFAVARIAAAQLCRAAGVERSAPSVVDAVCDVMLRMLARLAAEATAAADADDRETVEANDVILALATLGLVRPRDAPYTAEDIDIVKRWLSSPDMVRAHQVAHSQTRISSALGMAQGAALAAQQANHDGTSSQNQSAAGDELKADWLRALVRKQLLMGQDKKFRNTSLGDHCDEKVVIAGGPASMEEFFESH